MISTICLTWKSWSGKLLPQSTQRNLTETLRAKFQRWPPCSAMMSKFSGCLTKRTGRVLGLTRQSEYRRNTSWWSTFSLATTGTSDLFRSKTSQRTSFSKSLSSTSWKWLLIRIQSYK